MIDQHQGNHARAGSGVVRHGSRAAALVLLAATLAACSDNSSTDQPAQAAAPAASSQAAMTAADIRAATGSVDGNRIKAADQEPGNWMAHGRTWSEQRFSPLDQVNEDTVKDMGLAWSWDTGSTRGLEATPIVVDGVMFTTGTWSRVQANDARTGELLWKYDPEVPREWGVYACCDAVNRGVAVWKGRVYSGTLDGYLVALDAATGEQVWKVKTIPEDRPYTITGAPRVLKDMVIIGNGGAEYGVRGYVSAYDTATGKQKWRFYTVPGNPDDPVEGEHLKQAMSSWRGGKWWEIGGGGTVWDSMAYDPELDLLYIGVGNGAPWNRYIRSPGGGDNLYLSSMVAIKPDTGEMAWHFQTTPGDTWDYTATQHMILADLEINGQTRKVIMQAPKNGFFYVLDRTNGEFISAEAYVPVNWATHVDPETGRPVENPEAHYANEAKLVFPAPYGGHNWHPMAFNPNTNLVYIPALDIPFLYGQDNGFKYNARTWNTAVDVASGRPPDDTAKEEELRKDVKGFLAAWDPVAQKEVWRVQHSGSWNGGLLSTAGNLVFQGRSDGMFAAYTADTGKLAWEFPVYNSIIAAPVTYSIDGEQYVAVMAGWGGAYALAAGVPNDAGNKEKRGRLLAFKIGGSATLPTPEEAKPFIPDLPPLTASQQVIDQGGTVFHTHCSVCHGPGAVGGGVLPDLRYAGEGVHAAWDAIVLDGAFKGKGMVGFDGVISKEDAQAIHQYVIMRAQLEKKRLAGE